MSTPNPPPPDQTVGYENVHTHDVVTARVNVTPVEPNEETGNSGRSSSLKSRPSFGSVPAGKSVITSTGQTIPPEALIGPYEIIDELGKGGMGVVYRARHVHLGRIAALKMIIGGMRVGPEHLERFRIEAEAVAKLDHPNCVRVYDVGEHLGNPYIALELIDGGNLQKRIAGKPQPAKYAATMIESVARAVHAAHEKGIVHRDLKPANVLLTLDGQPKVTDFGLAKNLEQGTSGQTNAGSILGTPSYMAPEQAAGRVLDIGPATDVYALGAMLYELLLGHPPFRAETAIATIRMVLDGEVVPPRTQLHTIPKDLDTICLKALEKPIHRRYESAAALAEDLRRYLDGEPIVARPIGRLERFAKWVRRKPAMAATIGTGVIAAVLMIVLGVWSYFAVTKRAREAEEAKSLADATLEESNRRLVRLNVANGTRHLDDGDYLASLLWYAEALRLEKDGPAREHMHRVRIRSVLDHCPTLAQFWTHDGPITTCDFDSTGLLSITGSADGIARVWDTVSGKPAATPIEHGAPIQFVRITPDGRFAVTAGQDGSLKCWDVGTSKMLFVQSLSVQFTGVELTPDGTKVAACGAAGRVRIWEVPTGKDVSLMTAAFTDRTTGMAFSPDGTKYVVGSTDNSARVFETATSQPITPLLRHNGPVNCVRFSPDGKRVATASSDDTAQVWDVETGLAVFASPFRHGDNVTSVAFSPDGQHLVTASLDNTAQVWDATTGRSVGRPAAHESGINSVRVSPDGSWFVTSSDDNTARVWDIRTGSAVSPPFRGTATPSAVEFSPQGHQLLICRPSRVAILWDLAKTTTLEDDDLFGRVDQNSVGVTTLISPNGEYSVSFGINQPARVRKTSDHEPVGPPLQTAAPVSVVCFDAQSKHIVTGDVEGNVQVWTIRESKPLWEKSAKHSSRVLSIAVSDDGRQVATGSDDNTVGLWQFETGQSFVPAIRLGASGHHVAFQNQGQTLLTRTADGRGRLWDTATGEPLTPSFLKTHTVSSLEADTAAVEELTMLGRLYASGTLGETGGIVALNINERKNEWQKLNVTSRHRFEVPASVVLQWHERSAAKAEAEGWWYAAAWHLDVLLKTKPNESAWYRRRASVAAELGDWKRAERDATNAIKLNPTEPAGWYQRGVARGHLNHWGAAAADLAAAVSIANEPTFTVGLSALVAAEANDRAAYEKACLAAWNTRPQPASTPLEMMAIRRLGLAVSVRPDSGIPPAEVAAVVSALPGKSAYSSTVQALCEFREGKINEALKRIEPIANDPAKAHPAAWALLYALHTKAGSAEKAKPWKTKCLEWLATADPQAPTAWDVRVTVVCLLGE